MSRITRLAVLVTALMSLVGVLSSSAGAATWHNSGSSTVHATAGPETLSSTSAGFACPPGGTMTGTVAATPAVVPVGNWAAVTGTLIWTGCTLGVSGYSVECGFTLTASSWTAGTPAVTTGLAEMTCGFYLGGSQFCHVEGSVNGHYRNPSGSTSGSLTTTTGGNLTVTNGPAGTCPLGNGDIGHLSEMTFSMTNAAGSPILTRT